MCDGVVPVRQRRGASRRVLSLGLQLRDRELYAGSELSNCDRAERVAEFSTRTQGWCDDEHSRCRSGCEFVCSGTRISLVPASKEVDYSWRQGQEIDNYLVYSMAKRGSAYRSARSVMFARTVDLHMHLHGTESVASH